MTTINRVTPTRRVRGQKIRDAQILRALAAFVDAHHGIPPTLRELAEATGYQAKSPLLPRLTRLVAAGYCYALPDWHGKYRAVTITQKGRAYLNGR